MPWLFRAAGVALFSLVASSALAQVEIVDTIPGQFIDITKDPNAIFLPIGDDDEASITTTIGNSVLPAGTVVVGNNGAIGFNPPDTNVPANNTALPNNALLGGGIALAAMWDDIGNDIGSVTVLEGEDRLIVQWTGRPLNGALITFQVQVFDESEVTNPIAQFLYLDIDAANAAAGATCGFQAGSSGLNDDTWSLNEPGAFGDGTILTLVPEPAMSVLLIGLIGLAARRR